MSIRNDPENKNFVFVRCESCKEEHRIKKNDWKICEKFDWYILVYKNGEATQTSHFNNIKEILNLWRTSV